MNDDAWDVRQIGYCVEGNSAEPWAPADIGRNFRACARGIGGQYREHQNATLALRFQQRYPVLTEAGALLLAEKGDWAFK